MLHFDASSLLAEAMATTEKTLKVRVAARLKEIGKTPSELGAALGYKFPYDGYHKIFVSQKIALNQDLREKAARFLDWPLDAFDAPLGVQERREALVRAEFESFLRAGGQEFDQHVLRTLEGMRFYDTKRLPTAKTFQFIAMILSGEYGMAAMAEAMQLQATLEHVPSPKVLPGKPGSPGRKKPK